MGPHLPPRGPLEHGHPGLPWGITHLNSSSTPLGTACVRDWAWLGAAPTRTPLALSLARSQSKEPRTGGARRPGESTDVSGVQPGKWLGGTCSRVGRGRALPINLARGPADALTPRRSCYHSSGRPNAAAAARPSISGAQLPARAPRPARRGKDAAGGCGHRAARATGLGRRRGARSWSPRRCRTGVSAAHLRRRAWLWAASTCGSAGVLERVGAAARLPTSPYIYINQAGCQAAAGGRRRCGSTSTRAHPKSARSRFLAGAETPAARAHLTRWVPGPTGCQPSRPLLQPGSPG